MLQKQSRMSMLTNATDRRAVLARRLLDYHSVGLEAVLSTIAYLREPGDSVIVGGSLADGLGNPLSDLDLVIVGEKTVESSRVPLEHFVDSLRVDVWVLSELLVDGIFTRAEQAINGGGRVDSMFGDNDNEINLKLVHRIAFGIPLDGPELGSSTSPSYAEIAQELVVREYLERMREHAFLAQLAMSRGRHVAAVVNAREAIEEALHATITAGGVPFSGQKWLQVLLAREAPELEQRRRRFATLPAPSDAWDAYVMAAIAECEALTQVTLGTEAVAANCAWINSDLRLARIGVGRAVLLSRQVGAIWELDAGEIDTWRTLVESEDRPRASWLCSELSADQAALCFDLYEQGCMSLEWASGIDDGRRTAVLDRGGEI